MREFWPSVPLREVLQERQETPSAEALTSGEIRIISKIGFNDGTIQLRADGQTKTGMILIRPGDLVVSGINAAKGAIAFYGEDNTAPIAGTIHYGAYIPDRDRADVRFLWWLLRSRKFRELLMEYVPGGIKTELKAKRLLPIPVPLPPLREQRHIVMRITQLAARIEEARHLRHQAIEELQVLRRHAVDVALNRVSSDREPLERFLAEPLMNGLSISASKIGSGIVFAKVGVVNTGVFNPQETKLVDVQLPNDSPYWLRRGDIVVSRGNTVDLVGRAAVYEGDPPNCALPDLLIRICVKHDEIEPRFLSAFFHSSEARTYIESQIGGTSSTMPKISQPKLRAMPVPMLPLAEQRRMVRYLDGLTEKAEALKQLQVETAAQLDALLPAILDRVFRGEIETSSDGSVSPLKTTQQRQKKTSTPKRELVHVIVTQPIRKHSKGLFYRRAALDCYIISALPGDPNLGRTKIEKLSHLIEYHCGVDLERQPVRDAAGPNDYPSRMKVESLAARLKWYSTRTQADRSKVDYVPGPAITKSHRTAERLLGTRKTAVDALLRLMRPLDTKQSEIITTLYAAWNDFLLGGKTPTDDELVQEVRENWHPEKRSIPVEQWRKALIWMRNSQLVPRGVGKPVPRRLNP